VTDLRSRACDRRPSDRPISRGAVARLGLAGLLVLAAPTAGDIGSCGQALEELDPVKFFTEKRRIDCQQCQDCELQSQSCEHACAGLGPSEFPAGCYPLVHDGEVCLRALRDASCSAYETYVADAAPAAPTECNFCSPAERPGGSP
jgi:hypothetical protein